jgi:phosphatidate cytidylyltransferase
MTRVVSGVVLAAAVLALIWFTTASVLLVAAMGVAVLAFREYAQAVRAMGVPLPEAVSLLAVLAALAAVPFRYAPVELVVAGGFAAIAVAALMSSRIAGSTERAESGAVATQDETERASPRTAALGALAGGAAILYLGLPIGMLVGVYVVAGREAALLLIGTVALSDTAQYYTGRALGRRPLAPRLSPKKTREGALGGIVVAPLCLAAAGPPLLPLMTPFSAAAIGLTIAALGIAGDLFESAIKRAAHVKDSSALIPGHGGVLDRIDALLFAAPPFYLAMRWLAGV